MRWMYTFIWILSLLFSSRADAQSRGELYADTLVMTLTKTEIKAIYETFDLPEFFFPIDFETVDIHRIAYYTLNGRGDNITTASGLVTIPVNYSCAFPLVNYNHGSLAYDEVLSEFMAKVDQHYVGVPFAANGYVAVLPDLLGYGATPVDHPHPYIHAKSEATAVVDMLRATRQLCDALTIELNDELFLLGYSQGGHTTMAAHRELEENHPGEFTVTASAPCSGPYDVSGILFDSLLQSSTYSNPFFISFVALSYQYVYQNLFEDVNEIFQPPYDSLIARMLDRNDPQSHLRDSLPVPGIQMFQPDYLLEVVTDPGHPFRENLRDNDLYAWTPIAPVRLYYCTEDEQIPYGNALFTADTMSALGADIYSINAGPYDHFGCTPFALVGAKLWFDQYRTPCVSAVDNIPVAMPRVFPNPFSDVLNIWFPSPESGMLQVHDLTGKIVRSLFFEQTEQVALPTADLPAGAYSIGLDLEQGHIRLMAIKNN